MIVHILRSGRALCGLSEEYGTPNLWPADHLWVTDQSWRKATCVGCVQKRHKKKKKRSHRVAVEGEGRKSNRA